MLGLRTAMYPVHDLAQARDWFAHLLDQQPYFDEVFYVGFEVGGFELGLVPVEGPHQPSADGATPLWGVADLDATWARALALGATALEAPHEVGGGIGVAMLQDPFGNRLGFIFNPHFAVPPLGAVTLTDPPNRVLGAPDGALAPVDIVVEQVVAAPRAAVWAAWTQAEALGTWFGREARMTLQVGGPFEILFYGPDTAERGSEGCKVLAWLPERMLSFSWNAPPHLAFARRHLTWVVVELADVEGGTAMRLTHTGWPAAGFAPGGHPEWPATRAYFAAAWPQVLAELTGFVVPKAG